MMYRRWNAALEHGAERELLVRPLSGARRRRTERGVDKSLPLGCRTRRTPRTELQTRT